MSKRLLQRRYGNMGGQRFPFMVRLQWPVKVIRLHVFVVEDGLKGHADDCWCKAIPGAALRTVVSVCKRGHRSYGRMNFCPACGAEIGGRGPL